ncbi:MAG: SprB repeat-containing protein [Bacteroidetes bacterium]|nr:SprB repeat-containing protein [Bacteroidota bacterium]
MNKVTTLLCLTLLVTFSISLNAQEKRMLAESEADKVSWQEIKERTKLTEIPVSKNYPAGFEGGPEFQKLYEPNGPYEFVYSSAELFDKRDATTKHFQNANGTITAISSAGVVHYRKNNKWHTILNDIYPSNTLPGFGYANTYNAHQTYYGNSLQNGIQILTENNDELRMMQNAGVYYLDNQFQELGTAGLVAGSVSGVNNEVITYKNVFPNVEASVTQNSIGYELDYILGDINWLNIPSGTQYISFREGLKLPSGYHAELEQGNQILLIKNGTGQLLLKYKAPSFYEKNNEWGDSRIVGQYHTTEKNGFIYIDVLVPATWLTSAQRTFPVVVDPTVIYNPNNTQFWTFQVDNDAGCDYNPQNDADDNIRAGFDDGTLDDDYFQGYAQYNIASIPDNACFQLAYARWYQYNFQNGNNGDNQLDFYLQPYDPITTDPSNPAYPCSNIDADIDNTATIFRRFNAFNVCGGACTQYPTANNQWKDFYQVDMKGRVQASLPYDFFVVSVDKFNNNHSDPIITDNDEWIDWRGHSNANRPQLWVTYEVPFTAATSITASPSSTVCNGTTVTLTRFAGTTGTAGNWAWYQGSTFLQYNNTSITVSPSTTTTYCVRGENACGNTACTPVTITVQQLSTAPTGVTGTTTICNGASTTLSVSGGSLGAGASWNWYSGSCGGTFVGTGNSITVSPSTTTTYFVRAIGTCNTTGCVSATVVVNTLSTAPGSVTVSSTPICNGQSTTLSVNGGSLGTGAVWRWYSGSCGGTLVGTGLSISVSPTATTTYFVRAEGTCNTTTCASAGVSVLQLSVAPISITGTSTICNGQSTTLSVSGGSLGAGATWQWYTSSCGGTSVGSGSSISVSPTATTTYFVRAEGTCNTTTCAQLTLTVNQLSTAATGISGTTTICEGTSTTLSVVGGTLGSGANWQWYIGTCGGTAVGNGPSLSVTPATNTDYYVRAEGTCNTTSCVFVTVTVNDTSEPASSVAGSPAICIGGNTNLSSVGGQLGVGASWNWYTGSCGGTLIGSGTPINVAPTISTTYYLRAEGLCNTTVCTPFTVNVNPLPNGSISGSATLCSGFDTTLTFNFNVGTAPFDVVYTDGTNVFSKSGVSSGDTINELVANTTTYTISQITDANGCVRSSGFLGSATITVAPLPAISNVAVSDVLCNGGNTGSINITASSGTPAYQYSIDSGATLQSGNSFGGLTAGNYNLLVSDALNCQSAYTFNPVSVNEPAVLDHVSVPANASCDNVFDGSITVNVTGGTSPYTYSINGGSSQPGSVFNGLLTGTYNILVTDFNGCSDTSNVFIDTAYSVQGSIVSQTPVSCFGGTDGTVTVQLVGGITPYSYSINGVQFVPSPTFTGLASGNYVVTLRDSKGCTDFANVTITQPALLQAQIDSIKNIGCNGDSTGAIYISVSGGNSPYNYTWSNGAVSQDVAGLLAGTYNVAIIDAKGCSAAVGATISQPLPLFLNIASFQNVLCNGDSSGDIDLTANGGVPPYTFAWSNGQTTEDVSNLPASTYSVTVTDANGCDKVISQAIAEPASTHRFCH